MYFNFIVLSLDFNFAAISEDRVMGQVNGTSKSWRKRSWRITTQNDLE